MDVLSYMHLFVEVAKRKSFRHAAEALGIANSTLSRNIADLEASIGIRLLHRSTRKVELTEAGEAYFRRCQSIVDEALSAHEALLNVTVRPIGTLRVTMTHEFGVAYLAPILADFARAYPLIKFEFDINSRAVDLTVDPFDLAIRLGTAPVTPATLVVRAMKPQQRYLYASPEYLRLAPPLAHARDLANHVLCVGRHASSPTDVWRTLYRGDEKVEVMGGSRYVLNSSGMAQALAVNGIGIAALDAEMAKVDVAAGRLQRILPEWVREPLNVYLVTDTRRLPARTQLFIAFLKERLGVDEAEPAA